MLLCRGFLPFSLSLCLSFFRSFVRSFEGGWGLSRTGIMAFSYAYSYEFEHISTRRAFMYPTIRMWCVRTGQDKTDADLSYSIHMIDASTYRRLQRRNPHLPSSFHYYITPFPFSLHYSITLLQSLHYTVTSSPPFFFFFSHH